MRKKILSLIDKPLADTQELSIKRLNFIENELINLTDEYLNIFKDMLETNDIDKYKEYFLETDFYKMKSVFEGKVIKDNFSYMSYILNSFYFFK